MQPDAATPFFAAIDLLARADELALAASAAIVAGDDESVLALLDTRGAVITAAIDACGELLRTAHTADELVHVTEAAEQTVAIGAQARAAAILARTQALEELASLDAGQQGAHEYQPLQQHGQIDVVL